MHDCRDARFFFNLFLSMPRYIICAPLLGGLFHGLTWFAWPIIIMLILSSFFPVHYLTPVVALLGLLLNLFLIIRYHKRLQRAIIKPLLVPSLLWIPFWYILLRWIDSFRAKKIIAFSILFFLCVQWFLKKKQGAFPQRLAPLLAWLGGIFGFAYNVNWPQLAARLITKKFDKDVSVLISTTYFFLFGAIFVFTHRFSGGYDQAVDRLQVGAMLCILLVWSWWGDRLHNRLWEHQYQQLLTFFLLMSAIIFLV